MCSRLFTIRKIIEKKGELSQRFIALNKNRRVSKYNTPLYNMSHFNYLAKACSVTSFSAHMRGWVRTAHNSY